MIIRVFWPACGSLIWHTRKNVWAVRSPNVVMLFSERHGIDTTTYPLALGWRITKRLIRRAAAAEQPRCEERIE